MEAMHGIYVLSGNHEANHAAVGCPRNTHALALENCAFINAPHIHPGREHVCRSVGRAGVGGLRIHSNRATGSVVRRSSTPVSTFFAPEKQYSSTPNTAALGRSSKRAARISVATASPASLLSTWRAKFSSMFIAITRRWTACETSIECPANCDIEHARSNSTTL